MNSVPLYSITNFLIVLNLCNNFLLQCDVCEVLLINLHTTRKGDEVFILCGCQVKFCIISIPTCYLKLNAASKTSYLRTSVQGVDPVQGNLLAFKSLFSFSETSALQLIIILQPDVNQLLMLSAGMPELIL